MKVVNVCSSDWANFAHQFSQSLKAVGIDSTSYCLQSHPFGYPEQSEVVNPDTLPKLTRGADFVILHHSCIELLHLIDNKKIIHYAAGTKYRQDHEHINQVFKPLCTFIALPEFAPYTENFHYIVGAVDSDGLDIGINVDTLSRFGHYPSNPDVKGTEVIDHLMKEMDVNYVTSNERVPYLYQLGRMAKCDVYIELLAPTQGGKAYGSFGMTALEAAAMGKVVITQNLTGADLYRNTYGEHKLRTVKDANAFRATVKELASLPIGELRQIQKETKEWLHNTHGYVATGNRVKSILETL